MTDKKQLPFLLKLVDDESSEVRDNILAELSNYGANLEEDLYEFTDILEPGKIDLIYPIIESSRRAWLKENWIKWQKVENEYSKLEVASNLIARFQYGLSKEINLSELLNKLTDKFIKYYPHGDELSLANFLFKQERIEGEKNDFYNPFNSNLVYAIEEKKGIPITLAIIYMLIGKRLNLKINGCNFPGHFLTKFEKDGKTTYVDTFNSGRIISEDELQALLKESYEAMNLYIQKIPSANTIIRRILQNLINAYKENEDQLNRFLFAELLESTPSV